MDTIVRKRFIRVNLINMCFKFCVIFMGKGINNFLHKNLTIYDIYILEVKINFEFKKGVGIAIKSKETSR